MPVTNDQWDAYKDSLRLRDIYFDTLGDKAKIIVSKQMPDIKDDIKDTIIHDLINYMQNNQVEIITSGYILNSIKNEVEKDPIVKKAYYAHAFSTTKFNWDDIEKVDKILNDGRISEDEYMFLPPKLRKNYKRNSVNRGTMPNWTGHGMMNPYRTRNYNPYIRKTANNNSDNNNQDPHGGARRTRKNRRSKRKTRSNRR